MVLLGHLYIHDTVQENFIKTIIQSVHMPLFFFLSGYLMRIDRNMDLKDFFVKKAKSLLVPYSFFSVISFIYWLLKLKIQNESVDISYMLKCVFCLEGRCGYNDPLWFLLCLFFIEMAAFIFLNNKNRDIISVLVISIVSGVGFSFIPRLLSFKIDSAIVMFPCFIFGYIANKYQLVKKVKETPWIFFTLSITCLIIGNLNGMINIYGGNYRNIILTYIASFTGVLSISTISCKIRKNVILEYMGRNSLLIMSTHFFVFDVFRLLGNHVLSISVMDIDGILVNTVIAIITVIVYIPVSMFVNKYLGFCVGKMGQNKAKI